MNMGRRKEGEKERKRASKEQAIPRVAARSAKPLLSKGNWVLK